MPDRSAYSVLKVKTEGMRGCDFYLGMVSGTLEFLLALLQSLVDLFPFKQRVTIHRLGDAMQFGIDGIEKNQPQFGKHPGVELAKGAAEILAGRIALLQRFENHGTTEEFLSLLYCGQNAVIENNFSAWQSLLVWRMNAQGLQMVARRQVDKVNFGEIMVFGRQPEHRDRAGFLRQNDDR